MLMLMLLLLQLLKELLLRGRGALGGRRTEDNRLLYLPNRTTMWILQDQIKVSAINHPLRPQCLHFTGWDNREGEI